MYKTLLFAFIMLATIACNNDNSTQNASINTNNENTILAQKPSNTENTISPPQHNYEDGTYTWSKHNEPDIFLVDFQKALRSKDQEAVYQMMNIPFECNAILCGLRRELTDEEFEEQVPHFKFVQDYSIHNKKEFYEKYDFLFSKENLDSIMNVTPAIAKKRSLAQSDENYYSSDFYIPVSYENLRFSKSASNDGKFKLYQIPYNP